MKTVKDYNLPLNSLKQQRQQHETNKHCYFTKFVQTLSKQSNALQNIGAGYAFCPSNKLTFDLLTLKVVSESRVTWATSVPILVFLGLSILDLGPMYAIDRQRQTSDRQADVRQHHRLMPRLGGGITMQHGFDHFNADYVSPDMRKYSTLVI